MSDQAGDKLPSRPQAHASRRPLWLLIDGYNVVKPSSAPRRDPDGWLKRERQQLLDRLNDHLPPMVRQRTCVVFDAKNPPRGVDDRFVFQSMTIRFAVDDDEADDLIERMIARHSAAKQLMVVSSDRRLQTAANRRGAFAVDADQWLDDLVDDRIRLAVPAARYRRGSTNPASGDRDPKTDDDQPPSMNVDQWLDEFGF